MRPADMRFVTSCIEDVLTGNKNASLLRCHFYIQNLPRQARDQHAENYIKKEAAVVLTEIGVELPVTQVVSQPSPALRCPALRALHPFQCQFV
jgi:hypothetical protein